MLQLPILDGKVVGFIAIAGLEGSQRALIQMMVPMLSMEAIFVSYSDVFSMEVKYGGLSLELMLKKIS
jgi:hypothetical protein